LVIAVEILVTIADFNTKQGNVSTEQDVENYAIVSSNLLEPANRITWQELDQVSISVNKISLMSFDFWHLNLGEVCSLIWAMKVRGPQKGNGLRYV